MYVDLDHSVDQSTRLRGITNLTALLEFVDSEWQKFQASTSRTMRHQLAVPAHIQYIIIGGVRYELAGRKREIWFRKTKDGYDGNRFYLSEVADVSGHPWQLYLDRSGGALYDDLVVLQSTRLAAGQTVGIRAYSGPRVRD